MNPRLLSLFALAQVLLAARPALAGQGSASPSLLGFSTASATKQAELETRFDAQLRKENMREWMQWMTSRPHHLGSPFGKEVAEFALQKFKLWGYDARIEQFEVLFPTPTERLLELVAPEKFTALLAEPALPGDATSGRTDERLPTYNAYSIDGDVMAELVYVNYGVPGDYQILAERGIDVRGKIVIARYGGAWRGIKPKVAAEHGAIGCLIYSDPREDGFHQGDVYPQGAWRNEHGVQMGSVADIPLFPGDPLTPDGGSTNGAKRLPLAEARTLTKIPVLPIAYADALPLLRALAGPVAPAEWRGALPITYHIGPGPAKVHLKLKFDWKTVPLHNVIARLKGAEEPDHWVLRGNHHDAWIFGAEDPISGAVQLMEEARGIGELAKRGWKPKRTLVFALWDGEEEGLIGSTEWVETHANELRQKAVAYINGDTTGRGFMRAGGSHTLERFVAELARDVIDPQTKVTVGARLAASQGGKPFALSALGSGSDFSPFLQHLGVAALDLRYGGEDDGGSYHSAYDSFDHYTKFGDPGFEYCHTAAQTSGRAVLRLSQADFLPFDFTPFANTVARYVAEVIKLPDDMREEAKARARLLKERTFDLTRDPREKLLPPPSLTAVPFIDFAPLQNALARLQENARLHAAALQGLGSKESGLSGENRAALNEAIIQTERLLTRDQGLPRRPWYKHQIYAPGFYTGYGVKTLPGVREAIEERNWKEATEQIVILAQTLDMFAEQVRAVTTLLGSRKPE